MARPSVPESQDIFAPITAAGEKGRILDELFKYGAQIKVKMLDPRSDVFSVTPTAVAGLKVMCKMKGAPPKIGKADHSVIVQFAVSEQKYISQANFEVVGGLVQLEFRETLYKVQRRADFRLRFPSSYRAKLKVSGHKKNHEFRILDLSAGGCRIELPETFLGKPDQRMNGVLVVAKREDLEVELEIRYVEKATKDHPAMAGLQFVNQTQIIKNRMAALVMDLYREFFTKRS